MPRATVRTAAAILATLAPGHALADSAATYWDSVLARGVMQNVPPCNVARQDAMRGAAPYLPDGATDDPAARAMAAHMACLRNLGAWGLDPVAAAAQVARDAGAES